MRVITTLAIVAFVVGAAHAQNVIVGPGASDDSCGDWLAARRENNRALEAVYMAWMQGHLSGENSAKNVSLPSHTVIAAYLDQHCARTPTTPIFIHAIRLYFELQRQQGRVEPKR